ncbi:MAG: hypothetical protein KME04_04410 [Pleurocapsa minor GSE-CHR-MK-17-07R]|nr:hypothetical protein [Pleurocapsa minor GSE-CHR-MK 17-07R]
MQPANEAASWTAVLRMPSVPCMIDYHFEFAEGEPLYALRQVEALIPGTANPTFGAWMRQPFQITVYDPAAMPPLWAQGQVI